MITPRTLYTWLLAAVVLVGAMAPASAQPIRLRAVNLVEGFDSVDVYLNNGASPYLRGLDFGWVSAQSPNLTLGSSINLKVTNAGAPRTSAFLDDSVSVPGGFYYTAVLYGTSASAELALLERRIDQVAPSGSALLRFLNATSIAGGFDIYMTSTEGTPLVSNLRPDSASTFVTVPASSATLVITATGSKTPLATLDAPLNDRAILTMIITGSSAGTLKVSALNAGNTEEHELPQLQPGQPQGAAPTLRFVNVVPQPDARQLDVYIDGTLAADTVAYRSASGILPNVMVGEHSLRMVPAGQSPVDSVYGAPVTLARDTAYTVLLTQFSGGRIISMTLTRSLSLPPLQPNQVAIRFVNANDFRPNVSISIAGSDTATFTDERFLQSSGWRIVNAGVLNLQAFAPGISAPIFQGSYTARAGEYLTFIALGSDTTYVVDVLRETQPGVQWPMESFGQPQTSVRPEVLASARALRLQVAPNPIVTTGRITFDLPAGGTPDVALYDALGRRIADLDANWRSTGTQTIELDATAIPSGTYTLVVTAGATRGATPIIVR